ncbi:MAG: hypothetical protein A2V64_02410 [Bacteroidetes bacterium RBG_13_43_22]|nr:MAG: hypothetical protein A2V64_02410 [Bacteroidetes bacterium RBG_13_43_22]
MFIGITISFVLTVVCTLAMETASGQTKDPLMFPKDNFTVETKTVITSSGEKKITYYSYLHIPYVVNPVDKDYQSLNISIPIKVDDVAVDASNAPILFVIGVGGYMSVNNSHSSQGGFPGTPGGMPQRPVGPGAQPGNVNNISSREDLALAAGYVVVSPGCRGRDNKAANEDDNIFASGCFSPITDLEHADMAYEWNYGTTPTRSGLADIAQIMTRRDLSNGLEMLQVSLNIPATGNNLTIAVSNTVILNKFAFVKIIIYIWTINM